MVKLDSFTEDTEYSLKVLNTDPKEFGFINDALYNRSSDIATGEGLKTPELSQVKRKI